MNINEFIEVYRKKIDETGLKFIKSLNISDTLEKSIEYSFSAGGKRIRPLLLLAGLQAFETDLNKGINTACALELIHTSSLIHDDLPAMDDDDYRRGRLTNHKVFGEATAILAGDALLVNANNLICQDPFISSDIKVALINELSSASGANGMIGGQEFDIENEEKSLSLEELEHIHKLKTGKLLQFPLVASAIIAGMNENVIECIREAAYHIGVAFQIQDDILDVTGTSVMLGKPVKSDEKNHKCTYVTLLGIEGAKVQLKNHYDEAVRFINSLPVKSELVNAFFRLIVERNK